MSISLPSKPCVTLDIPETKNFSAVFKYNFFEADEKVSEDGRVESFNNLKNGEEIDSDSQLTIERKVARYVEFNYTQVNLENNDSGLPEPPVDYIGANLERIYYEDTFSSEAYSTIDFQDTGIDGKMFFLSSGTMAKKFQAENKRILGIINKEIENLGFAIDAEKISLLEAAQYLKNRTPNLINDASVIASLNRLEWAGARFFDEKQINEKIIDKFEEVRNLKTRSRINNKFIVDAIHSAVDDPLGLFSDELSPLIEDLEEVKDHAVQLNNSNLNAGDYDIVVEPVDQRAIPIGTFYRPTKRTVGYIIEKFRVLENGKLELLDTIAIEGYKKTNTIDYKVAYGRQYCYQIRSIAEMTFNAVDDVTDDNLVTTILVASSPSKRIFVDCVENVPPKPPTDIGFSWDYTVNKLMIYWSLPVNTQRDIKYIQIFRRKDLLDPFELIQQFDFDDSVQKTDLAEFPNPAFVQTLPSSPGIFYDDDFGEKDEYIYALASIDAHGLTSNYSTQMKVYLNTKNNKLERELISNAGAPKQYPNMYVNANPFSKILTDSLHEQMTVYFEPEYFEVYGGPGNQDMDLLQSIQKKGKYKMQIINVDLQQAETLDIKLDDKRRKT